MRNVITLAIVLSSCLALPAVAMPLAHWDFESGDLQGWQMVSGNLAPQPSAQDDDRWKGNFGKQGRWFIGTCETAGGYDDGLTGELRSPTFTLHSPYLRLLVGGGGSKGVFVALVRACDGVDVRVARGRNQEVMEEITWDLHDLAGRAVYLRIVDAEKSGWGHLNVDDIRELSPAEVRAYEQAQQRAERAREARLAAFRRSLTAPSQRQTYWGPALTDLAMPLGGIGTGTISLGGRGDLREWQIFNNTDSSCVIPGAYFAVWAQAKGRKPVARLLQMDGVGEALGVKAIEFMGEYPLARLAYRDPALPVAVALEAWSPLIPLAAEDSAVPAAVFDFRVRNPGHHALDVSLLATCPNAVGYCGCRQCEATGLAGCVGTRNRAVTHAGWGAVEMRAPGMDPAAKHFGSMCLAAAGKPGTVETWTDFGRLWERFTAAPSGLSSAAGASGPISLGDSAPPGAATNPTGATTNCALMVPLRLGPGEARTVTFVLAWHFPNRYADYQAELQGYRIGNRYATRFADAPAVAAWVMANRERLAAGTRLFHDTLYDSTLPWWLLDCVSSQISTLRSPTTLWIEDGTLACFEGAACCPMNCTHVWNYEQTLAKLWPDLERNMRDTDFGPQQDPSGFIHHRTVLPLSLPRASGPFCDGHLGCIMKAYREHLQSADAAWLRARWPAVRRAMEWAIATYDPDGNGLLEGEQWNTYDLAWYGPNPLTGTLYLGALRAAEEMARVCNDQETAGRYHALFAAASAAVDRTLWNGEYYAQRLDPAHGDKQQFGEGCLSDQLLGQWFAEVCGLGPLLAPEHVRGALTAIIEHNFVWDFSRFSHNQRVFASGTDMGLLQCTWPRGGRPEEPMYYCDECWTGTEYQVAGHLLYLGMAREAAQIVRAARNRYDGVPRPPFRRNPWNEIECGEHYARAMSSWSLLLAAQGYTYDGPAGRLGFAPRLRPENHRSFFSSAQGWGTFAQRRGQSWQTDTITLKYGTLTLRTLALEIPAQWGDTVVSVGGIPGLGEGDFAVARELGQVEVRFDPVLRLAAGDAMSVRVQRLQ